MIIAFFLGLGFVVAIVFLVFGERIIMRFPTIRRFFRTKNTLRRLVIANTEPVQLDVFCTRPVNDVAVSANPRPAIPQQFKSREIGDVVEIVHYKEHVLKRIVKELRMYAFLCLVLGGAAIGLHAPEFRFSLHGMIQWVEKNPLGLVAVFELLAFGIFAVRLHIELQAIAELLDA